MTFELHYTRRRYDMGAQNHERFSVETPLNARNLEEALEKSRKIKQEFHRFLPSEMQIVVKGLN